jgi:hypothetical protein
MFPTFFRFAFLVISAHAQFINLSSWQDASQGGAGPANYNITSNQLVMSVSAASGERPKVMTNTAFRIGTYEWVVYIPQFTKGDISSVGSFVYFDDLHELDWECGYGKQTVRSGLGIANDNSKSVCYMTSQSTTGSSVTANAWYNLKIQLVQLSKRSMNVVWRLNNTVVKQSTQCWSITQLPTGFRAFCSLENLSFMGDSVNASTLPRQNYAIWQYFKFS